MEDAEEECTPIGARAGEEEVLMDGVVVWEKEVDEREEKYGMEAEEETVLLAFSMLENEEIEKDEC